MKERSPITPTALLLQAKLYLIRASQTILRPELKSRISALACELSPLISEISDSHAPKERP